MMTIYRNAANEYFTRSALSRKAVRDVHQGWDVDTQGLFVFSFDDWLIEAINTGVITAIEVND